MVHYCKRRFISNETKEICKNSKQTTAEPQSNAHCLEAGYHWVRVTMKKELQNKQESQSPRRLSCCPLPIPVPRAGELGYGCLHNYVTVTPLQ